MRKILLGLAPVLLALPSMASAAETWKVSETSGDVRLMQDGRSVAAARGALLASGAAIVTGPKGRAVIVRGEEFVVISPGSKLRVPDAASSNSIVQMIEDFGTAVFKIRKKSTPHFGVKTPYLAAVVKGTTFTVSVGPEGGSVQVTEGAVEVSTLDGGASDLIEPGAIASVGASDLYQLSVDGDVDKVIRSNQPSQGVTSSIPPAASYSGPAATRAEIKTPISEDQKSLGAITNGLIEGDAAIELAMVLSAAAGPELRQAAPSGPPAQGETPGAPSSPERPDGSGGSEAPPAMPPAGETPVDPTKPELPSGPLNPGNGPDDPGGAENPPPPPTAEAPDESGGENIPPPPQAEVPDNSGEEEGPPPAEEPGDDDGNNGHGNDDDGDDDGNPGNGHGGGDDDGNNGHGNDDDGDDDGNPGNGHGSDSGDNSGRGNGNGHGGDDNSGRGNGGDKGND